MAGDQERPGDRLNDALDGAAATSTRWRGSRSAQTPAATVIAAADACFAAITRPSAVGELVIPSTANDERDRRDAVAERGDGRAREDEPEVALSERAEPALQLHAVREESPSTISESTDVSASIAASRACARSAASSARRRAPSSPTSST